jgi:predicted MFS family arabinose efflux permease
LIATWLAYERRVPWPTVDVRMLMQPRMLRINLVAVLAGFSIYSAFVLVPKFVEAPSSDGYGFGASPTQAGLIMLAGGCLGVLASVLSGLGRRFGDKWPLAIGLALGCLGSASLGMWHDALWQIAVGFLALGAAMPIAVAAMATMVLHDVRPAESAVSTGMNTVLRTIGSVIGAQVAAAVLSSMTIPGSETPSESAFVTAFALSGVIAFVGFIIALGVAAPRPAEAPAFT